MIHVPTCNSVEVRIDNGYFPKPQKPKPRWLIPETRKPLYLNPEPVASSILGCFGDDGPLNIWLHDS